MKRALRLLGVLAMLASGVGTIMAQDVSDDELRREIRELKERLSRLEAILATRDEAVSGAGTEVAPPEAQPQAASPASSDPSTFKASWSNGLSFETPDEKFSFQIGGRVQNDWAFFAADDPLRGVTGPILDGTEFRRARVLLAANLYNHVDLKAEYDFAGGEDGLADGGFRDVYIGLTDVPGLGNIRFGHQKEPFSLEEITSSKYITFLERALPNLFAPSRNTGVVIQNTAAADRVNLAAGVFRETGNTGFGLGEGGYNFSTRFTGLPWYEDGGRKLLHLGVGYSRQNQILNLLRYRQRPEAHLAPRFVNTGFFLADSQDLLGLEAAVVAGPFSVQSEYISAFVNTPSGNDPRFSSYYVQASFFATGENRVYKTSSAAFDRVKPAANFFDGAGGKGAWELAARYSHLDLDDGEILGGRLDDFTFGVNWYLNPNTRFMWNYVYADRENVGSAHIFQTRFHIDF